MANLPEDFAGTWMRWALLLEDHPGATHEFRLAHGTDLNIPEAYGGGAGYCVATISMPGRAPVTAYKLAKATKASDADEWNDLCSKTLGRALKRAGYPDRLAELSTTMNWRHRNAEAHGVNTTKPQGELAPAAAALDPAQAEEDRPDHEGVIDTQEAAPAPAAGEGGADAIGPFLRIVAEHPALMDGIDLTDEAIAQLDTFCTERGTNWASPLAKIRAIAALARGLSTRTPRVDGGAMQAAAMDAASATRDDAAEASVDDAVVALQEYLDDIDDPERYAEALAILSGDWAEGDLDDAVEAARALALLREHFDGHPASVGA